MPRHTRLTDSEACAKRTESLGGGVGGEGRLRVGNPTSGSALEEQSGRVWDGVPRGLGAAPAGVRVAILGPATGLSADKGRLQTVRRWVRAWR